MIWQHAANAQAVRSMPVTFKMRHQHLTQRYYVAAVKANILLKKLKT